MRKNLSLRIDHEWRAKLSQGELRPATVDGYMTHPRAIRRDFIGNTQARNAQNWGGERTGWQS